MSLFRCHAKVIRASSSGKALLCELETGDEKWIPVSLIDDESEVFDAGDNDEGELVIPEWFAAKEGIA